MADRYPIREVMSECAEVWNDRTEPISPFWAAAQFFHELDRRRLPYDSYLQTVITGGGHAYDPALEKEQAVERNVQNALRLAELLDNEMVIDLPKSAEAAAMPFIHGWRQNDWMTFWPLLMAKPKLQHIGWGSIRRLEEFFNQRLGEHAEGNGLDMNAYRDRSIDKSERLRHYIYHTEAMYETLLMNKVPLQPVNRVVGLLGIEESVGSTAEKHFAKRLGIRAFQAALAEVRPLSPEKLSDAELGSNIASLRNLGVQALANVPRQQFILVEDRQPADWGMSGLKNPL